MAPAQGIVLVTGGAGFIGSHVCRSLLEQGQTVYAVDNMVTGCRENLVACAHHPRFRFFPLDVTTPKFLRSFKGIPLNRIYHLACPTGVPNISLLGKEMLLACSLGTLNVLELARRHRAKLLFTSSCEVYGDPRIFPQDESYTGNVNPTGPRSAYEEGKRFSEALIATHSKHDQLDAKTVRLFNVYGPGMSPGDQRVLPKFLKAIQAGEPLPIFGNGRQTRTFVYIDDLVRALFLVMEKGASRSVYNIGGDRPLTMNALANLLSRLVGRRLSVVYRPHFTEDHIGRQPSLVKIRGLGWRPRIRFAEGLRFMMRSWGILDLPSKKIISEVQLHEGATVVNA